MGEFDLELNWGSALRRHESPYRLRLDPWIEAQAMTIRQMQFLLRPSSIRLSLFPVRLDESTASHPPPWLSLRPTEPSSPLVPRGAGPETPRSGEASDILEGILAVPAVDSAVSRLRAMATEEVMRDWRRLSTGERAATVSTVAVIGGGAIATILSDEENRRFALNLLADTDIPVPLIPGLSLTLDIAGSEKKVMFTLDVNSFVRSMRR